MSSYKRARRPELRREVRGKMRASVWSPPEPGIGLICGKADLKLIQAWLKPGIILKLAM